MFLPIVPASTMVSAWKAVSYTHLRNTASLRVLEKCGYRPEGLARRYLRINGVWEDHIHMVRLNEPDKRCV